MSKAVEALARIRRLWWQWGITWWLLFTIGQQCLAGVLVAPTVVFLSEKRRTGRITIQNPSDLPKEVTISIGFGLPVSDSLGNVSLLLADSAANDPRSAAAWVRAFPRRVVLAPGATQVVRLVANPPAGLDDGEYWARIIVRSQEGEMSIPAAAGEGAISTRLNMVMQTAIMLKYRTGNLFSQLSLRDANVFLANSKAWVTVDLVNEGNVSYMGVLKCRLLDPDGKEISSNQLDIAVYRELTRRLALPLPPAAIPHRAEIVITNEGRNDIPAQEIVPAKAITTTLLVR